ncbi:hypothetical protein PGTUg99_024873 [Puccinia graminis f. sp. tritici]|uniref:Uncharacterized protein n=1 Tax=Puccinia graminis f. sp. tritici TaxID=56615 RepID=A0A5B0SFQ7_PUCGR|nr:hypothetical protein PGTUg99_024873 [Puccinia graminis f. sp. tritici]
MIIADERNTNKEAIYDGPQVAVVPSATRSSDFSTFLAKAINLRSSEAHFNLRDGLVKHLWALKGASRGETDVSIQ